MGEAGVHELGPQGVVPDYVDMATAALPVSPLVQAPQSFLVQAPLDDLVCCFYVAPQHEALLSQSVVWLEKYLFIFL